MIRVVAVTCDGTGPALNKILNSYGKHTCRQIDALLNLSIHIYIQVYLNY